MCGCAVPVGCSGRVLTTPVFVGLGTNPLPAGDARCPWIPVATWCCGGCPYAARLDARSCWGLCGVPALVGAGASVVRGASAACCWCGVVTDAGGAEVDGPEDVEAVIPCGARTPDGARARTFMALVAVLAQDWGGGVVTVAVLREEEKERWCRAIPAIIMATAALPYVPGHGGGRCGWWASRANALGTRFAQVELHRKTDVCTQLHQISASCKELHRSCTVQFLCNRAGSAVVTAPVAAAT